jgi:hypothetical protein
MKISADSRMMFRYKNLLKKLNSLALVASELYGPSDRRLSVELMPTFADRGCHVVSATDPHGR